MIVVMSELEIHHESGHAIDPAGQKVGVLAAVLAVALAVVTIASHRTHTSAIIHKSNANDAWSHYQSTRVKYHNLELGENLLTVMDVKTGAAARMLGDYKAQEQKYDEQGKEIQEQARKAEESAEADEHRALRYDLGEGLLEIGLVLSSLYFISHKKMFPAMGLIAGVTGGAIALAGLL
jgi:hypothetical protein